MRRHRRHISLSLSLSTPWFLAEKASAGAGLGAPQNLPAGVRRAHPRGVCRSPILAISAKLGRSSTHPRRAVKETEALAPSRVRSPGCHRPGGLVASKQVPSRAPTRVGRWLERRGLADPGSRRSALELGCSPHNPWRAAGGAWALACVARHAGRAGPFSPDLLAPRRYGGLLRLGCSRRRGGGC
jgi:hypothetical protein